MTDTHIIDKAGQSKIVNRLKRLWFGNASISNNSSFACGARTKIFIFLSLITAILLVLLLSLLFAPQSGGRNLHYFQIALVSSGFAVIAAHIYYFQRDFLLPLTHLRRWVHMMRGGNLQAQIPYVKDAEFADLAEDLNMVGMMLLRLSEDAENQLQEHTKHITSKTRSLQILYNLSAKINYSSNMEDLLTTFLQTICDVANAEAAAVWLVEGESFRLVKATGLEKFRILDEPELDITRCSFGKDVLEGKVVWNESPDLNIPDFPADNDLLNIGMVSVPLMYRDRTLGVFNLFVDIRNLGKREEMDSLLLSIGQHGGMAIEKLRLDAEAHRLNIMEEREHLSHELHDSLAQTLVSLRFQIRVLDESIESDDKQSVWQQLERIENTIDEANIELRELITHFRAPIDKRGVMVAIKQIIRRFQEENDISVFLQQEWPEISLPGNVEIQVLRIIQETLANIRKHSNANTVRIILRGNENGEYYVLVEDDGSGFDKPAKSSNPGEHIGLGIMRERAQKLGGKLIVDSEPGEGTRVVLKFTHPPKKQKHLDRSTALLANN